MEGIKEEKARRKEEWKKARQRKKGSKIILIIRYKRTYKETNTPQIFYRLLFGIRCVDS